MKYLDLWLRCMNNLKQMPTVKWRHRGGYHPSGNWSKNKLVFCCKKGKNAWFCPLLVQYISFHADPSHDDAGKERDNSGWHYTSLVARWDVAGSRSRDAPLRHRIPVKKICPYWALNRQSFEMLNRVLTHYATGDVSGRCWRFSKLFL